MPAPERDRTARGAALSAVGLVLFALSVPAGGAAGPLLQIAALGCLIVGGGWLLASLQAKQRAQRPPRPEGDPD
ncbi:hypothetical protein [Cellulomonas denverensis]|uniref:Uncharacterized protein n=1 Tax=Cellulomonas denverensis TaxID=264297 RepID=A0A7X6R0L4_9CELL|nr:hypothetical protein [Cellulomonas denverensis]NKY24444.1 hypothetical protein [Cellulomonas denverensis]